MPTLIEHRDSPKFSEAEATRRYWLKDATEGQAGPYVLANVPALFGELPLQDRGIKIDPTVSLIDWDVTVQYGNEKSQQNDPEFDFSFDFSTQNVKITQAKKTIGTYAAAGEAACDFGGAIGWDGNEVHGCEVMVPTGGFSEKWWFRRAAITTAYKRDIMALIGCKNDAAFRGWDPGEVLLIGASGTLNKQFLWEIQFKFSISENKNNLLVGTITIPTKKGWDYVWSKTKRKPNAARTAWVPVVTHATVVEIYEDGDYSWLAIG